jgi:hypothetical protein
MIFRPKTFCDDFATLARHATCYVFCAQLSASLERKKRMVFQVVSTLRVIAPLAIALILAGCTGGGGAGLVPGNAAGLSSSSVAANMDGSQNASGSSTAADGSSDIVNRVLMPIGRNPNPLGGRRLVQ